jgi:hypothetical protein
LQSIDWIRLPLLQGFATSAISGAEGLVRASRSALTQFLNNQLQPQRREILMAFLQDISTVLSDNIQDDRFAIPAVEFVAFLIDSYIPVIPEGTDPRSVPQFRVAYVLASCSNIQCLIQFPQTLYPYPKITSEIGQYGSIGSRRQSICCINKNRLHAS